MRFSDYFYRLAHEIFKRTPKQNSDTWKYFQAVGPLFQSAKETIFRLREQAILTLASGNALDLHGADRRLPRLAGESDEEYRRRLLMSGDLYKYGHTKPGMESILRSLGYPKAEVYPLYMERYKWRFLNGSFALDDGLDLSPLSPDANLEYLGRWAEFIVYLNIGDTPFLAEQKEVLKYVVNKAKPHSAKLYAFKFILEAESRFRLSHDMKLRGQLYHAILANPNVLLLNNRMKLCDNPIPLTLSLDWRLDGKKILNGFRAYAPNTWFLRDDRQRFRMLGAVRLNNHWAFEADAEFKGTVSAISELTTSHRMKRMATRVSASGIGSVHFLHGDYRKLSGTRNIDGSETLSPTMQLSGWTLDDGNVRHNVNSRTRMSVPLGGWWDLSQGYWTLDGGGSLYQLDGRWNIDPYLTLDGSARIDGAHPIGFKHHLNETSFRIDGGRLLGGQGNRLDGKAQLRAYPVHHDRLTFTAWKRGKILEKGAV